VGRGPPGGDSLIFMKPSNYSNSHEDSCNLAASVARPAST
jgi:hypothetical protein